MSAGQLARHRSFSSTTKPVYTAAPPPPPPPPPKGKSKLSDTSFIASATTASLFLYAQGSDVICLHHDTLAVERRFQSHTEDIIFIAMDNVSERGAGRLVATYDVSQTAIVWDLFSGAEVARFATYEQITVAAWMRNGNVAFGNVKGEVILFEPSSVEHISARTIFDPITAIAPSSDCKTYAIGYNNGSILLAALQPSFTILHTLTTSRGPSPIAALCWHASSSKQKSDMLATQTSDGDLRVWSVAKPPTGDLPRVIRVLKRADSFTAGLNWISWSKNGRIVQYSERETWSWDVRTKHVTYEPVPTIEDVKALACYGPTATLFTLGLNHTVQQYDLERPQLVARAQHPPIIIPPTPPEENKHLGLSASESEEDIASPLKRANQEASAIASARNDRNQSASPRSTRSQTDSLGSPTSSKGRQYEAFSPAVKTERSGTTFSFGTQQSQYSRDPLLSSSSLTYPSTIGSPASTKSARKASRLRQEILPSPIDKPVAELFPFIRSRLSDIPYKPIRSFDESRLTPDDLRRQMLSVVFGWEEDIQDLLRDELSRHPVHSQSAVLISKWLDDDPDHLATMMNIGGTPSSLDWMMLALSGVGNQAQSKKIGQAFVEKMLAKGDIHVAATILLALGDRNDAIEVYVTRNYFMEAVLLTCLLLPTDWQRQSFLVRKWGEHVVENAQQHLAIRCFACTGVEPTDPWTSPTAQLAARFESPPSQSPDLFQRAPLRRDFLDAPTPVAMPAIARPVIVAVPPRTDMKASQPAGRMTAKTSALKLITTFGAQSRDYHYRFPGLQSADRTPTNAPGVTPIAESAVGESALSPGGLGSYRLNNIRSLNSALSSSARTATPGGFIRQRLPSIGETPVDVSPPTNGKATAPKPLPTPADSGSEKEKDTTSAQIVNRQHRDSDDNPAVVMLTSARYQPADTQRKDTPLTAVAQPSDRLFSLPQNLIDKSMGESRSRNGSRGRKPDGLSIQMVPVEESTTIVHVEDLVGSQQDPNLANTAISFSTTNMDTHSEMTSPSNTSDIYRTQKSPSVSGRSIDQYISSLDEAQYYRKKQKSNRGDSRGSEGKDDPSGRKRSKNRLRAPSEDERGRSGRRVIAPPKRSPSSPVPMSPEDLNQYSSSADRFDSMLLSKSSMASVKSSAWGNSVKAGKEIPRAHSRTSERQPQRSSSRHAESKSKTSSRGASRRRSPGVSHDRRSRGRSKSNRADSAVQSPTSPLPMSPFGGDEIKRSDTEQAALRLVSSDRQRLQRSGSRRPERGTSSRRDASPDRRKARASSSGRPGQERESGMARKSSVSSRNDLVNHNHDASSHQQPHRTRQHIPDNGVMSISSAQISDLITEPRSASNPQFLTERRRKELAAAELEARRLSLARRPSAPPIPFPGQVSVHGKSLSLVGVANDDPSFVTEASSFAGRMGVRRTSTEVSGFESNPAITSTVTQRVGHSGIQRGVNHRRDSEMRGASDVAEVIVTSASNAYSPVIVQDVRRSMSAPIPDYSPPLDLPMHPAFDRNLPASRSSSKGRDRTFSPGRRDPSRERQREQKRTSQPEVPPMTSNSANGGFSTTHVELPPILPELQHLASPPPPPPAPAPPGPLHQSSAHYQPAASAGMITTIGSESDQGSAVLSPGGLTGSPVTPHKRGRSNNENLVGKIRTFTDRMRSTSRGRNAQSPQEERPSPYESIPAHNFQLQALNVV